MKDINSEISDQVIVSLTTHSYLNNREGTGTELGRCHSHIENILLLH